jgi:primosomal protein N' (replication factor Y) (superfamily II helicase)
MQYVEILPMVTTGAGDTAFTYESEEDLALGSMVTIPLRNRKVKGMVVGIVPKPSFPTKPVTKIQANESVLSAVQIEVAKKIADNYYSNLSDVISCMLPFDFGKKRREVVERPKQKKLEEKLKLTKGQESIYKQIRSGKPGQKYLLFGVTGSGKTEIYLQLAADALKEDKGVIILIPEISLTPQTSERFIRRFGDKVAIWHSNLKETEKYHTWQRVKSGEVKIVLGARSAIFTPISNLGYIVIDEEHESSYKQDQNPRYETAQVAEWITELTGAKLLLGSATPKIETFEKTQTGEYNLCTLNERIADGGMPPVKIIDLRDEFKKGNKSIFSDDLYEAATEALKQKKQVLLFVNRRGASTFVVCRDCGSVLECPHCEIPLTYHPNEGERLICHHCDHSQAVPTVCPNCSSHAIKYFGLGTQRVEIEAKKLFPKAKIARMDRDTTRKRGSHEEIYEGFANKDFDILIGTQLIAKGWDLPNVAVVGVISADTMLNLPDFRSSERTFDLLTQVAGRTGRGYHPGQVFVQTYSPDNYAIIAAAHHDFNDFYQREIKERQKYGYPPFSRLIKLTISHKDEGVAAEKASKLFDEIVDSLKEEKIQVLGPNPAFIPKLANKYRYQVIIRAPKEKEKKLLLLGKLFRDSIKGGWTVDVDPDSLL